LAAGVTPKDLALHLLGKFGSGGAKGHVVEYAGEAVRALDVEGRLTLCNMATEFSAFSAFIAADDVVFEYLKGRPYAPKGEMWDRAVAHWRTLRTDPDAVFDTELEIDAAEVTPMVTWGTSPQQAVAVTGAVPAFEEVSHRDS